MEFLKVLGAIIAITALASCLSSPSAHENGKIQVHQIAINNTNSFLITDGKNSFLFDSGLGKNAPKLSNAITELGVEPNTLRALILSHGHADHAGGASYFQTQHNVPVIVGMGDEKLLSRGSNDKLCPVGFMAERRHSKDQSQQYAKMTPDQIVSDSFSLSSIAGIDGEVIRLPGHTDGSLVVVIDDFVLVGDLLRGGIFARSKAKTHFYMCDLLDNQKDLKTLMTDIAPKAKTIFAGHFGPIGRESVLELIKQNDLK